MGEFDAQPSNTVGSMKHPVVPRLISLVVGLLCHVVDWHVDSVDRVLGLSMSSHADVLGSSVWSWVCCVMLLTGTRTRSTVF